MSRWGAMMGFVGFDGGTKRAISYAAVRKASPEDDAPYTPPPRPTAECCLYPWPDPDGTPLYPATDLPDTLTLTLCGVEYTLNKVSPLSAFPYSYDVDPPISVGGDGGDGVVSAQLVGSRWELVYVSGACSYRGPESTGPSCLVGSYSNDGSAEGAGCCVGEVTVEDNFADTYIIHSGEGDLVSTRVGLCRWEAFGVVDPFPKWVIEYRANNFSVFASGVASDTFGWFLFNSDLAEGLGNEGGKQNGTGQDGKSPAGVYDFGSPIGPFTVT